MHTPLISIISINYNTLEYTRIMLESLKGLNYRNFEVIIVDNASSEDPTAGVLEVYPEARVIVSGRNLGFSGGNNLGIRAAKGEYFLLLNTDTEVSPDLLEKLLQPFIDDPQTGMVSPRLMYYGTDGLVQYAGFRRMHPITGRTATVGHGEQDRGQFNYLAETYGAHGAAMMVSRKVVEQVGEMPEIYFLYYEEWDWSTQIRRAGYKVYYQGHTTVLHKESVSTGLESPLKAYYHIRNRILYMRRNARPPELLGFLLFISLFAVPKAILGYLLKGRLQHLKSFVRGLLWNIKPVFPYKPG